ncbi:MAG: hypothetical protein QXI65_03105 [Metallosphaera sp.]
MKGNNIPSYKRAALIIIALAFLSCFIPLSSAFSAQSQLTISYERYVSVFYSNQLHRFHNDLVNASVYYYISNSTYTSSYLGHATDVASDVYLYQVVPSNELLTYNGTIKLDLNQNGSLTVVSQIPQLIRLVVNSSSIEELAWAGLLMNNQTIKTNVYVNGTGSITLVFINGSSLTNVTFPLKVGEQTFSDSLKLVKIYPSLISHSSEKIEVQQNFPRRYVPEHEEFAISNNTITSSANYNTTLAYLNGSLVPALVWKGEGLEMMGLGFDRFSVEGNSNYQFTTIEFFGVNGTSIGYIHVTFISKSGSREFLFNNSSSNLMAGEIKWVLGKTSIPSSSIKANIKVKDLPVIITITDNDSIESTAFVNVSHVVFANEHNYHNKAYLVEVSINGTYRFVLITKDGNIYNVSLAEPEAITITNVTIDNRAHVAQKVLINGSQNVVFNVSPLYNQSFVVYKQVNGTIEPLNSTNYFIIQNKIFIYDDPSNVYYIVYGVTPTSSTNSTGPQSVSSNNSQQGTPLNSDLVIYGIIILIVAVIVILVLFRRK